VASEHERIAEIRARLGRGAPASAGIELSIGDDAAILKASSAGSVLSVDAQVEGVHFRREWLTLRQLGARALASALSDLAAMGAAPRAALLSIICPSELADQELYEIIDGAADAQARYGCAVVGGNLARGTELSITTTVIGASPQQPLTRSGAQPGDGLYVTGTLGSAALGLELLKRGLSERAPGHAERWRVPIARIADGARAAEHAHAAIDVSDGLLQDLRHVCAASSIGCVVDVAALPRPAENALALELGLDLERLALSGGEDYELLVAAAQAPPGGDFTRIGTFCEGSDIRLRDAAGALHAAELGGFDHFGRHAKSKDLGV
jgi:thiamine-monophosphate kinase